MAKKLSENEFSQDEIDRLLTAINACDCAKSFKSIETLCVGKGRSKRTYISMTKIISQDEHSTNELSRKEIAQLKIAIDACNCTKPLTIFEIGCGGPGYPTEEAYVITKEFSPEEINTPEDIDRLLTGVDAGDYIPV